MYFLKGIRKQTSLYEIKATIQPETRGITQQKTHKIEKHGTQLKY